MRRHRRLVGIGAFWPPIYFVVFIALMIEALTRDGDGGDPGDDLLVPLGVVIAFHAATILLIVALVVLFAVDAFGNPRVSADNRVVWLVLLVVLGAFVLPVYWWLFIRPGDPPPRATGPEVPSGWSATDPRSEVRARGRPEQQ